ncbi:MAG: branched-chain amino acid ABC transporter permease [Actinomycetota bacterium]|nr:branched-chain amino acid ABC transporter permease [Actinomycetota bacterium]
MSATLIQGSSAHRTYRIVTWGLFVLLAVAIPFWAVQTPSFSISDSTFTFSLGNLSHAVSYMVAVLGLGLLIGYNGQISLGNSFFMGLGAYITATLVVDREWSFFLTLLVVIPVTFLVGMLVGVPALRIRGLYLALVTLGLAAIFPALVRLEQVRDQTGGANGKRIGSDLDPPSWLPLESISEWLAGLPLLGEWVFGEGGLGRRDESAIWTYLLLAAMAAVAFWVTRNLIYSRPGRSIIAIRDNETGAAVSGVNLSLTKTLTFGMSAALGGVAGTMYAMAIQFVAPDVFGVNLAIFLVVGLVVGGVGTLSGAVVGGIVIIFVPLWASQVASVPGVPERFLRGPTGTFFLGALLIILTFVLPGGVIYGARRLRSRLVKVQPSRGTAVPDDIIDVHEEAAESLLSRHDSDRVSGL